MATEQLLDLISRKALIAEYDRVHVGEPGGARKLMEDAPTVDAAPMVHGRWIDKTESWKKDEFRIYTNERVDCSVCDHIFWHNAALTYNYCPNCGARMDGDKHE
jgi:hypothetical protein